MNVPIPLAEIFGSTVAPGEKSGDVVEYWLGLVDIACMTKGSIDLFPADIDPERYLSGLERVRASVVHAKTDSVIHARNQLSCACGCWFPYDGDDGDDDDDGGDDDDDDDG